MFDYFAISYYNKMIVIDFCVCFLGCKMKRKETFYEKYIKRCLDFCGALIAIILLSIPMALIALLVRIRLGSPVFYSATRIGKDEKPFKMYKFRSMTNDCDDNGQLLPDAQRMTSFGSFLRSTSADELPELFSILKGDMAFIGPRPLPPVYLPYYTERESLRHTCRGGMSGFAQINGRTSITWDEKFAYDVEYVENMSFKQDCKIFFKTIGKVFSREDVGAPDVGENVDLYSVRDIQRPELVNR